ncbi:MAG: hypothetical protein ABIN89_11420, partial [Chitinophagaceae bacterium]
MKKLLLLIILGFNCSKYIAAQSVTSKEPAVQPADSISKKEQPQPRLKADTKKISDNPAYNFKNLFESDATDVFTDQGP